MSDLFKALYALFTGSALAAALTGGLHNTEAPQGTRCPYGVMSLDACTPQDLSLSRAIVRIDLYSNQADATQIAYLHGLLLSLYDGKLLEADLAGRNLGMDLEQYQLIKEENYWRAITTFAVAIVTD